MSETIELANVNLYDIFTTVSQKISIELSKYDIDGAGPKPRTEQ